MARLTNAERMAHAKQMKEAREQAQREEYPQLLMNALRRASLLGLIVTVNLEYKFSVWTTESKSRCAMQYTFSNLYSPNDYNELKQLDNELEAMEAELEEATRLHRLQRLAIEKLTKEEQEALEKFFLEVHGVRL